MSIFARRGPKNSSIPIGEAAHERWEKQENDQGGAGAEVLLTVSKKRTVRLPTHVCFPRFIRIRGLRDNKLDEADERWSFSDSPNEVSFVSGTFRECLNFRRNANLHLIPQTGKLGHSYSHHQSQILILPLGHLSGTKSESTQTTSKMEIQAPLRARFCALKSTAFVPSSSLLLISLGDVGNLTVRLLPRFELSSLTFRDARLTLIL